MEDKKTLNVILVSLLLLIAFMFCTKPYLTHLKNRHEERIRQEQMARAQEQCEAR